MPESFRHGQLAEGCQTGCRHEKARAQSTVVPLSEEDEWQGKHGRVNALGSKDRGAAVSAGKLPDHNNCPGRYQCPSYRDDFVSHLSDSLMLRAGTCEQDEPTYGDTDAQKLPPDHFFLESKNSHQGRPDDPRIANQSGFACTQDGQGDVVGCRAECTQDAAGDQSPMSGCASEIESDFTAFLGEDQEDHCKTNHGAEKQRLPWADVQGAPQVFQQQRIESETNQ